MPVRELPVSDVFSVLFMFHLTQESVTKCIWVGREGGREGGVASKCNGNGVRVRPFHELDDRTVHSMTDCDRLRPTATASLPRARSLGHSHTWPRHTIDFRRGSPPLSPSLSSLQFYVPEKPIYTLLIYWSLNFIGCDDGADLIWPRAKFPRSTDLDYFVDLCLRRVQDKCRMLLLLSK